MNLKSSCQSIALKSKLVARGSRLQTQDNINMLAQLEEHQTINLAVASSILVHEEFLSPGKSPVSAGSNPAWHSSD